MYREKHVKFSNRFLLKEQNLVSGFRESGICPLHEEEVLKRMNTLDDSITESAEKFLSGSVVKVLKKT